MRDLQSSAENKTGFKNIENVYNGSSRASGLAVRTFPRNGAGVRGSLDCGYYIMCRAPITSQKFPTGPSLIYRPMGATSSPKNQGFVG